MAVERIGIIGAGSMGSMMAMGLAERGVRVSVWDVNPRNIQNLRDSKHSFKGNEHLSLYTSLDEFVTASSSAQKDHAKASNNGVGSLFGASRSKKMRRVFLFSISHGAPADQVIDKLVTGNHLQKGDIFLDGGNEHWKVTEARQIRLDEKGVSWIGMGVSGGYQAARHGPSLTLGGDKEACQHVWPTLSKFAARAHQDPQNPPCISYVGPGGAGHFVKMVHNGIEQGMLGALCEVIALLRSRMPLDKVANALTKWNEDTSNGELRSTYLIDLSARVAATRDPEHGQRHLVERVLDKVVQDADGSEGTGAWTLQESAQRHVPTPTIAVAHYMRLASANRGSRLRVGEKLQASQHSGKQQDPEQNGSKLPAHANQIRTKDAFATRVLTNDASLLQTLCSALKAAFLASFCQGLELIARASKEQEWDIDLADCLRAWRNGCIVQCDGIVEPLLHIFVYDEDRAVMNLKMVQEVSDKLQESAPDLKGVVMMAIQDDYHVPTLASSLEYIKYVGSQNLPTDFMEALMDAFGAHGFDSEGVPGEDPGKAKKGANHHEWLPA